MTIITYGKSSGPSTSKGRRRLRRLEAAKLRASEAGIELPPYVRSETKAEKIGRREACPRHLLATITNLSFRPYSGDISTSSDDAIFKVVNHAHQRQRNKKW